MRRAARRATFAPRRGFVLLTVVILMGMALLMAATVTWSARAEHAGRVATFDAVRRRTVAWSGAQAVAALVGSQRAAVLAGGAPTLAEQIVLYDDDAGVAIVRLLPASGDGALVFSESSLLDANGADAEALALAGLDPQLAERIIAARATAPGGGFATLEEMATVEGVDAAVVRGTRAFDPAALAIIHGARGDEQGRSLARAGESLLGAGAALRDAGAALRGDPAALEPSGEASASTPEAPPEEGAESPLSRGSETEIGSSSNAAQSQGPALADRLTTFSVEPSLARDGSRRAELDGAWAETMREQLGAAVTPEVAKRLEALVSQQKTIASEKALVEALIALGIEPAAWPPVLDRLTAERGLWRRGRIDINRAPIEVLATLPGVTAERAARIVRERDGLAADERATSAWLVLRGIVEPTEFAELAPRVTTRSFFWRVRFVAGVADIDEPDGPLHGVTIWECVIDLSAARARLASLRELTMAPVSTRLLEVRARMSATAVDDDAAAEGATGASSDETGSAFAGAGDRLRGAGSMRRDDAPLDPASSEAAQESPNGTTATATDTADAAAADTAAAADAPRGRADTARRSGNRAATEPRRTGAGRAAPPGGAAGSAAERRASRGARASREREGTAVEQPAAPLAQGPAGRFRLRPGRSTGDRTGTPFPADPAYGFDDLDDDDDQQ